MRVGVNAKLQLQISKRPALPSWLWTTAAMFTTMLPLCLPSYDHKQICNFVSVRSVVDAPQSGL
jgi:hypothetical protein